MAKQETIADIIAEMRDEAARADMEQGYSLDDAAEMMREFASRFEAAWKRERQMIIDEANDDTALVKNCATCKHYCRNKKYCPAQDTVNVNPDILPIFRTGPCDKWKCKYTKERHPWMSWGKCVAEYQKRKEAGEYGPY